LLSKAKRWCVDGTFKLCRPPFTQLFTINAFVRQDDHAKLSPAVVCTDVKQKEARLKKGVKEGAEDAANYPERGAGYS